MPTTKCAVEKGVFGIFWGDDNFVAFVIVYGCICFMMGCQLSHFNANDWAQISYGAFSVLVIVVFWTNMKKKNWTRKEK